MDTIEKKSVATIRTLSIDAIEKANSGHPGMPMGAAPMAYTLWTKFMNVSPANPGWFNRDRFVLSAGHGSALLYSMLHLSGFDLSIEDLKGFRQWGSKTPGHPEFGHTAGVDATTGPLGQGIAISVLSFLVWTHHFFTMGNSASVNSFFSITTMAISIPTGVKIFNWLFTMYKGRISFTTPMLWALAFIPTSLSAGLQGLCLRWQQRIINTIIRTSLYLTSTMC